MRNAAAKNQKRRCSLGDFRPDASGVGLSALGIGIPWMPRNSLALRQAYLDDNDAEYAYSAERETPRIYLHISGT